MKKVTIFLLIFLLSLVLYSARNEEEQGPPPLYSDENKLSEEEKILKGKNAAADKSSGEKRSFKKILEHKKKKKKVNRKKDELDVPWSDNGRKPSQKKYQTKEAKLKAKLSLKHSDIIIKAHKEYLDLYIRKKENIKSILLTTVTGDFNTNRHPGNEYALRSMNYIKENGNELLLYKGKFLGKAQKLYFLITSTITENKEFKKAFHLRVPRYVIYGYKWENFGTLRIAESTKINIRTFAEKFASYKSGYADNVITVNLKLYSGRDFFRPSMKIYKLAESKSYVVAYVVYKDNNKYFKNFLVSVGGKEYKEIFFSRTDTVRDLRGILIYSKYDVINKKVVKFKFYIEKKDKQRIVFISGQDSSGNKPENNIRLKIPVKGVSISTITQNANNVKEAPQDISDKNQGNKNKEQNSNAPPPLEEQ